MFSDLLCNIFSKKLTKPKVWIVSDGTDTLIQSKELSKNLTSENNIFEFNRLGANSANKYPNIAIGVGYNTTDTLLGIKSRSKGKTKIAIILDPLKNHADFDFIILPSYEPYNLKGYNLIYTTGLINYINKDFLNSVKTSEKTKKLLKTLNNLGISPPYSSLIVGGKHTGGNISEKDTEIIASHVNKKGKSLLISNSRRTEKATTEKLKELIRIPTYFYDYHTRETENYYDNFLSISDEIIVTGDSVRMMSEAVSSGKNVKIYKPLELGFQYNPLIEELLSKNLAVDFFEETRNSKNSLNEAKRVAEIIRVKIH